MSTQKSVHNHPDEQTDWDGSVQQVADIREEADVPLADIDAPGDSEA